MSNPGEFVWSTIIKTQGRDVTWSKNAGTETETIRIAPANFFRNFAALEETIIEGKEYIVLKKSFVNSGFTDKLPQRSDRINDSELGKSTVEEVREVVAFGVVIGYRIRTN